MSSVLSILVGLVATLLLGLGTASMLAPSRMLANFALEAPGAAGLNTVRGVIGGLFLGSVSLLAFGLGTGQTHWFLAVACLLGAVAVGRLVGVVLDGLDTAVVPPLVLEVVMVGILVGAHLSA